MRFFPCFCVAFCWTQKIHLILFWAQRLLWLFYRGFWLQEVLLQGPSWGFSTLYDPSFPLLCNQRHPHFRGAMPVHSLTQPGSSCSQERQWVSPPSPQPSPGLQPPVRGALWFLSDDDVAALAGEAQLALGARLGLLGTALLSHKASAANATAIRGLNFALANIFHVLLIENLLQPLIAVLCLGVHQRGGRSWQRCAVVPGSGSADRSGSRHPSPLCCLIWLVLPQSSVQAKEKSSHHTAGAILVF